LHQKRAQVGVLQVDDLLRRAAPESETAKLADLKIALFSGIYAKDAIAPCFWGEPIGTKLQIATISSYRQR
jgi:hypothetical protein